MVPFDLMGVEGKPYRVTGITFDGTGYTNAGRPNGMMKITGTCKNFRIDHCAFKNADQILVLDDGKLVGKGSHRELMATCETYREIALSQLSKEELA